MSDYRVDIKVRNNVFLYRLEKAGYNSIGEMCRINKKMSYASTIGSVVNMTESPFQSDGDWRKPIKWCADKLNCAPEDLFNDSQLYTVLESNKRHVNVSEAEMKFMIEQENNVLSLDDFNKKEKMENMVEDKLNTLTLREEKIIKMRFGLGEFSEPHTLEECGKVFGITRSRIRDIEAKAMRKLRHPSRSDDLKELIDIQCD